MPPKIHRQTRARTLGSGVCVTSSGYRHCQVVALDSRGGIGFPVLRRGSGATRRVNSSLRSHRTRRSQCRRVCSGLNKTLFASVGPNLRCRGRQLRCPATPGRFSTVEKQRCQLGRIKPSRGHRLDGMSPARSLAPPRDIAKIPPHVIRFVYGFRPPPFASCGRAWPRGPCWRRRCDGAKGRLDTACRREPSRTGCAAAVGPSPCWPCL